MIKVLLSIIIVLVSIILFKFLNITIGLVFFITMIGILIYYWVVKKKYQIN